MVDLGRPKRLISFDVELILSATHMIQSGTVFCAGLRRQTINENRDDKRLDGAYSINRGIFNFVYRLMSYEHNSNSFAFCYGLLIVSASAAWSQFSVYFASYPFVTMADRILRCPEEQLSSFLRKSSRDSSLLKLPSISRTRLLKSGTT